MGKSTKGILLPRKVANNLQQVGEQLRLARLRRDWSLDQLAERTMCSRSTLMRVEKGSPTVAIGIYLRVLYALGLDNDILLLAANDELGRNLQDIDMTTRHHASKQK